MAEKNKSVCDFLGYHLRKCSYQRNISSKGLKSIALQVANIEHLPANKIRFDLIVNIELLDGALSEFIYSCLFLINDRKWFEEANKDGNFAITQLFSIVFPYVRSSIASISNDSISSIQIPVINVIGMDILAGAKCEFDYSKIEQKAANQ